MCRFLAWGWVLEDLPNLAVGCLRRQKLWLLCVVFEDPWLSKGVGNLRELLKKWMGLICCWFKEVQVSGVSQFLPEVLCCFKYNKLRRKACSYKKTFSSKALNPSRSRGTTHPSQRSSWEIEFLAPEKGEIHWRWPFSPSDIHKCALPRWCYLTVGIRTCSTAGSAARAHWQVRATDTVPTGPQLWKGHVHPGEGCHLPFKNSRNRILSVTATHRATENVLQLSILLQIRATGKTSEVKQNKKPNQTK